MRRIRRRALARAQVRSAMRSGLPTPRTSAEKTIQSKVARISAGRSAAAVRPDAEDARAGEGHERPATAPLYVAHVMAGGSVPSILSGFAISTGYALPSRSRSG